MIQRIQTLFLSLAVLALTLMVVPFDAVNWVWQMAPQSEANPLSPGGAVSYHHASDNTAEMILAILSNILSIAAIFLFSNRPLQVNVAKIAMWTTLSALLIAAYCGWKEFPDNFPMLSWGPGAIAYLTGILMLNLAVRQIRKDDKLVRSMDRLR